MLSKRESPLLLWTPRETSLIYRLLALYRAGIIGPILAEGGEYWLSTSAGGWHWDAENHVRCSLDTLEELCDHLEVVGRKPMGKEENGTTRSENRSKTG